jgi:hypothetical protein
MVRSLKRGFDGGRRGETRTQNGAGASEREATAKLQLRHRPLRHGNLKSGGVDRPQSPGHIFQGR